ncbi:MAG: hypothetical protein IJW51_06940 [Clostridia bacterium]|nr:hypothetical protein [Clostridia bacterium]
MYGTEVYDKVYFQENYKDQIEALRSRYRDRTQRALKKSAVDHAPTPNATTIVYLHDEPDGGVRISTGDFVEYFNRRYGGSDRIGAVRTALSSAAQKVEKNKAAKKQKREAAREAAFSCRMRFARRHVMLVNALFAFILMMSIALLAASGVMLQNSETALAQSKETAEHTEVVMTAELLSAEGSASTVSDGYLTAADQNTVEVYETKAPESGLDALLNALSYLW